MLTHEIVSKLSSFYGISIYIYSRDHNPPHFHVYYGEFSAIVRISNCEVLRGEIPERVQRLVREWLSLYRSEVLKAWNQIQEGKPIDVIEPLR